MLRNIKNYKKNTIKLKHYVQLIIVNPMEINY